ncbi:hypothetical protein NFI96_009276 [Prochilodus magdalenae]|nr:hypothetical protein NFI96_009276 [Prochilodus magdalenae]
MTNTNSAVASELSTLTLHLQGGPARYLGLHLDERLDWTANTDILYRKGQSRLYFLRRLGSFNVCRKLLQMFYQTVVSSCLFYAVVCWGGSIKKRDEMRLDKLVRRAGKLLQMFYQTVVSSCLYYAVVCWGGSIRKRDEMQLDKLVRYNSGTCHLQKFSDDTAIVGCIRNGQEAEYRKLVSDFVSWCKLNQLQLNISKTKEMVVDFRKNRSPQAPVTIDGEEVEVVCTYKYLGVHLDNKLDWSSDTSAVFKRGQSRLYFLRKLRSFGVCTKHLWTFYQSVVASAIFYSVVCWGNSINKTAINKLNKLVKKAGSVIGLKLDTLEVVADKRTLNKLLAVMDNASHPLHYAVEKQWSMFSGRLRQLCCAKERRVRFFLPTAIRLYNESPYSSNTTDLLLSELC